MFGSAARVGQIFNVPTCGYAPTENSPVRVQAVISHPAAGPSPRGVEAVTVAAPANDKFPPVRQFVDTKLSHIYLRHKLLSLILLM